MANQPSGASVSRLLQGAVRYGYIGLLLIGFNTAALALVLSGASYHWLIPLLLLAFAIAFAAERILPAQAAWNEPDGDVSANVGHAVFYEVCAVVGVSTVPGFREQFGLSSGGGIWPVHWPLLGQFVLALVIGDCVFTLIHWVSHRSALLWRLHAVHHAARRLYSLNGLARHPLHLVFDMVLGSVPLVLSGMPVQVSALLGFATSTILIAQHSNVASELGPLRNWLSVGRLHQMHHVNWGREGDCNFGFLTTVWDRVLGTYRPQPKRAIGPKDLGIDDLPEVPLSYLGQLKLPVSYKPSAGVGTLARTPTPNV